MCSAVPKLIDDTFGRDIDDEAFSHRKRMDRSCFCFNRSSESAAPSSGPFHGMGLSLLVPARACRAGCMSHGNNDPWKRS